MNAVGERVYRAHEKNSRCCSCLLVVGGGDLAGGGSGFAAEGGHGGIVGGEEVADYDTHGAGGKPLAGGVVVGGGDAELVAGGEFVAAAIEERSYRHAEQLTLFVEFGVEGGNGFLAGGVFENDLLGVIVHMAADAEEDAVVFYGDGSGVFVLAGFEIVAGVAAGLHIHPSGVDALGGSGGVGVGNFHFEVDLVVRRAGGIVNHGLDADFISLLHAIAVAGDFHPVGELGTGSENVLFLIGAEKIGAIGVPERGVMKHDAGDGAAVGVDQARGVGEEKGVERNDPEDVGRLRHFHVIGVGGEREGALAHRDGVRGGVDLLL